MGQIRDIAWVRWVCVAVSWSRVITGFSWSESSTGQTRDSTSLIAGSQPVGSDGGRPSRVLDDVQAL